MVCTIAKEPDPIGLNGDQVPIRDDRGRRRLQCDDAGWVRFSKLLGCHRIVEHLNDDQSRTTEGAAATRVEMLREEAADARLRGFRLSVGG